MVGDLSNCSTIFSGKKGVSSEIVIGIFPSLWLKSIRSIYGSIKECSTLSILHLNLNCGCCCNHRTFFHSIIFIFLTHTSLLINYTAILFAGADLRKVSGPLSFTLAAGVHQGVEGMFYFPSSLHPPDFVPLHHLLSGYCWQASHYFLLCQCQFSPCQTVPLV